MEHSIDFIVTGLSSIFNVHAASHGAGQIRPVNSGKLLVECNISIASLLSLLELITSYEIYGPIIAFFFLLILAFIARKLFFKN